MSAIPVFIVGTITTKSPKEGGEVSSSGVEQCVIHGLASIEGLSIGGGPIIPPGGGGGQPPGIWGGGNVPMPNPPIANVPGAPGYEPPGKPPDPIQPPIEWKAVWTPSEGWVVVGIPNVPHPAPSGQPQQQQKK